MKYKIFSLDENGKISFEKEELEKLLEEVYNEGYKEGEKVHTYYPKVSNIDTNDITKTSFYYKNQDKSVL